MAQSHFQLLSALFCEEQLGTVDAANIIWGLHHFQHSRTVLKSIQWTFKDYSGYYKPRGSSCSSVFGPGFELASVHNNTCALPAALKQKRDLNVLTRHALFTFLVVTLFL